MYNFIEVSDRFLRQMSDLMGIKINQIRTKDNFSGRIKEGYYIINLDNKGGSGTHWTVMKVLDDMIIYFDSFGIPMPQDVLQKFAKQREVIYNVSQVQDIDSDACGYYVLDFMHYFNNFRDDQLDSKLKIGRRLSKYLQEYDINDQRGNEDILGNRLKNILN